MPFPVPAISLPVAVRGIDTAGRCLGWSPGDYCEAGTSRSTLPSFSSVAT